MGAGRLHKTCSHDCNREILPQKFKAFLIIVAVLLTVSATDPTGQKSSDNQTQKTANLDGVFCYRNNYSILANLVGQSKWSASTFLHNRDYAWDPRKNGLDVGRFGLLPASNLCVDLKWVEGSVKCAHDLFWSKWFGQFGRREWAYWDRVLEKGLIEFIFVWGDKFSIFKTETACF
jgi:hypothetical protein